MLFSLLGLSSVLFFPRALAERRVGVQTSFSPLLITMKKDETVKELFKRISEDEAHEESLEHINCKDYQLYRCIEFPCIDSRSYVLMLTSYALPSLLALSSPLALSIAGASPLIICSHYWP